MENRADFERLNRLYVRTTVLISAALSILVVLSSCLIIAGWVTGSDLLMTLFGSGKPIWSSNAISLLLFNCSLLIFALSSRLKAGLPLSIVAVLFLAPVLLGGFATAVETLTGSDFGLSHSIYQASPDSLSLSYPGPMTPDVSIAFVVLSIALLMQSLRPESTDRAQTMFCLAMIIVSLPVFGTLTGARALCTVFGCLRMSAPLACLILMSALAALLARADLGPAAILAAPSASGVVARRTSTLLLFIPVLLAVRQYLVYARLVDDPLSWAMFAVGATVLVVAIVLTGVRAAENYAMKMVAIQSYELTAASKTAVNMFARELGANIVDTGSDIAISMAGQMRPVVSADRIKKICLECEREYSREEEFCPHCQVGLAKIVNKSLVGEVFADKYEIIWSIGEGAMARVYKARHRYLDQMVALKVLNAAVSSTAIGIKRFQQEAKTLATVSHPNIVQVQDFGFAENGEAFLAMEYASGRTLADYLAEEKALSPVDTADIVKQLCDALSHAHDKGIVHRDLKPSNIICRQDASGGWQVKVVDFGLAKMVDDENGASALKLTQTGECHGSPPYMSPEQCMGKEVDFRTDIYALGCIIYECVSGFPPFYSGSVYEILTNHVKSPPPKPQSKYELSVALCQLLYRCLQKDPELRFNHAGEIKDIFESLEPTPQSI